MQRTSSACSAEIWPASGGLTLLGAGLQSLWCYGCLKCPPRGWCSAEAEGTAGDGRAESELLGALARALPEEANLRLEGLVTGVLARWPAAREALASARTELGCTPASKPPANV